MGDERREIAMVDRRTWRRDLIIVAALVAGLMFGAFLVFGDESEQIREAAIENCGELVEVQLVLTDRIKKNSQETAQTPFEGETFGLTQKEFARLIAKELRQNQKDIDALTPTESCVERFDG